MNRRIFFQTTVALALLLSLTARAGDWPQFRGPLGDGVAQEDKAPLHWGPTNNVRWKATLPGPGNSSPIVSHGRVFVTCAEDSGKKRNLYCFDRRTGQQLWMRTVEFPIVEPTYPSNPYCGSTPVADGARVVVWHGSPGVLSKRPAKPAAILLSDVVSTELARLSLMPEGLLEGMDATQRRNLVAYLMGGEPASLPVPSSQ